MSWLTAYPVRLPGFLRPDATVSRRSPSRGVGLHHAWPCRSQNRLSRIQPAELGVATRGEHAAMSYLYRHTFPFGLYPGTCAYKAAWGKSRRLMSTKSHRGRASSVSSIGSFATTPDSELSNMSGGFNNLQEPLGVGLSDPTQSAYRRKILGVIDRMRATG